MIGQLHDPIRTAVALVHCRQQCIRLYTHLTVEFEHGENCKVIRRPRTARRQQAHVRGCRVRAFRTGHLCLQNPRTARRRDEDSVLASYGELIRLSRLFRHTHHGTVRSLSVSPLVSGVLDWTLEGAWVVPPFACGARVYLALELRA